jgi:hypothetical protein
MMKASIKKQTSSLLWYAILLAAVMVFLSAERSSAAKNFDELWFAATPQMQHEGKTQKPTGKPDGGGRPGASRAGGSHSQGGHDGHESEHRPKPIRTYWLNTCGITEDAKAFVMRPDGEYENIDIDRKEHEVSVTIKTPFGEGPAHGANYVYLIDRYVDNRTLTMTTAKWLTIHHNCGWGHDHRFNPDRLHSQNFEKAPLEIVVDKLWDKNFHSTVMSGDMITFKVLSFGKPVEGATVLIESEKGWQKEVKTTSEGIGAFQMVRDYYPASWESFNRSKLGRIKMTVRYDTQEEGDFAGDYYDHVHMKSTFSWRYYPARQEYVSYRNGLLIAIAAMVFSGFGVFYYRERRKKPYQEIRFDEKSQ